jgi:hypothetical protein
MLLAQASKPTEANIATIVMMVVLMVSPIRIKKAL